MKNPLTLWKPKRRQKLKERILKNEEVILEALAKRAKGTKACPFLLGERCIADACEFWGEYVSKDKETGKEFKYFRCAFVQQPLLTIELIRDVNILIKKLEAK